jgi:hypothetical protein
MAAASAANATEVAGPNTKTRPAALAGRRTTPRPSGVPSDASAEKLRRLDVGEEAAHFVLQIFGLDRQRVGERLDVGGG